MTVSGPSPVQDELELDRLDAWWRAANYLAVGMIYLQDNPLLREPLRGFLSRRRGEAESRLRCERGL
jgi:phosphoketolase